MQVTAARLAWIDREATAMVERAAPIALRVARGSAQASEAFRLRYEAVVRRGWMNPEDFPEGMEQDRYDDEAIHLVAWDGDVAVGTARVVLPTPGRRLPTEDAFDLAVEPTGQVVDWGRTTISRRYRGASSQLFAALLAQCWLETRANGYEQVCGNTTAAVLRLYRYVTVLRVTAIGPPRVYWGELRYPLRFDFRNATDA